MELRPLWPYYQQGAAAPLCAAEFGINPIHVGQGAASFGNALWYSTGDPSSIWGHAKKPHSSQQHHKKIRKDESEGGGKQPSCLGSWHLTGSSPPSSSPPADVTRGPSCCKMATISTKQFVSARSPCPAKSCSLALLSPAGDNQPPAAPQPVGSEDCPAVPQKLGGCSGAGPSQELKASPSLRNGAADLRA